MDVYTDLQACRVCGAHPDRFTVSLDFGELAISTFPTEPVPLQRAPLAIGTCPDCQLAQLLHTVHRELLFQDSYWYASGINGMMREELRSVVREARQWVRIGDGDWVLDVGANDGTLLRSWLEHAWEGRPYRMAVEPSPTFARMLAEESDATITELFPTPALAGAAGRFKVITSIAMFYAVQEPVQFAAEVKRLLAPDGVWIVQMQDLHSMLRATAFDNVVHEHLCYYSVETFWEVARRAGLRILSYSPRAINGGSLRFVLTHEGEGGQTPPPPTMEGRPDWGRFADRMATAIERLQDIVRAAHAHGHTVDLLGASTKGNTLLQLAGLGPAQVRRCWERHAKKIGRYTVTGIPIVAEAVGAGSGDGLGTSPGDQAPDLLVCPIWQFREGLIEREQTYLQRGGRIYFPLPTGEVYMAGDRA